MKKLLLLSLFAFYSQINAQNVGIGNPNPTEKLDVTGNINVTGTIKANGVDGTANQVLMKNNAGVMIWGSLCDYKNFQMFDFTTVDDYQTFLVPPNIYKMKIQAWGGGGSSVTATTEPFTNVSGSGGAYSEGEIDVVPNSTMYVRVANFNAVGASGEFTRVYNITPTNEIRAYSGVSGVASGNSVTSPNGGIGIKLGTVYNFYSERGGAGNACKIDYFQAGVSLFYYRNQVGNGGNGGNAPNTGAIGGTRIYTVGTTGSISLSSSSRASTPGGGESAYSGAISAAPGRVILYW